MYLGPRGGSARVEPRHKHPDHSNPSWARNRPSNQLLTRTCLSRSTGWEVHTSAPPPPRPPGPTLGALRKRPVSRSGSQGRSIGPPRGRAVGGREECCRSGSGSLRFRRGSWLQTCGRFAAGLCLACFGRRRALEVESLELVRLGACPHRACGSRGRGCNAHVARWGWPLARHVDSTVVTDTH